MRINISSYILLILIVLMVLGVISLGDVMSVVFYIFMGVLLLAVIGASLFRYQLRRFRKEAERRGSGGGTYHRRPHARSRRGEEAEVTVEGSEILRNKSVRGDVGDYVEYEEIKEKEHEEVEGKE